MQVFFFFSSFTDFKIKTLVNKWDQFNHRLKQVLKKDQSCSHEHDEMLAIKFYGNFIVLCVQFFKLIFEYLYKCPFRDRYRKQA